MLNLTTRTQKFIQMGMTLALGATLFLSGSAGAQSNDLTPLPPQDTYCTEFKQVYAQTDFSKHPHQHLDVACDEGYRAISCEAAIHGKNDYNYSMYYVNLNEANPETFNKNSHGGFEHASHGAYYGCHFRANNSLLYFTPAYHPQYAHDFEWQIKGFATCVPKECVHFEQTYEYYDEYGDPIAQ
jgi:hypothetical protein